MCARTLALKWTRRRMKLKEKRKYRNRIDCHDKYRNEMCSKFRKTNHKTSTTAIIFSTIRRMPVRLEQIDIFFFIVHVILWWYGIPHSARIQWEMQRHRTTNYRAPNNSIKIVIISFSFSILSLSLFRLNLRVLWLAVVRGIRCAHLSGHYRCNSLRKVKHRRRELHTNR